MASAHPSGSDPRVSIGAADVRPIVAAPPRNVPWWVFAGSLALAAMLLFAMLDSRRRALTAPATTPRATDAYARAGDAPAALFRPARAGPGPGRRHPRAAPAPRDRAGAARRAGATLLPARRAAAADRLSATGAARAARERIRASRHRQSGAGVRCDARRYRRRAGWSSGGGARRQRIGDIGSRARIGDPQPREYRGAGDVDPGDIGDRAGFDAPRPGACAGAARRRRVRRRQGADPARQSAGRSVPRRSRAGQNRASVIWNRLVRPDGATIALASPAADTLGRGGIKGKVNSHFLERFGAAILQSTLDLGVNLASRVGSNSNSVVVGLPLGQGTQSLIGGNRQVQPTLTVRQGTTIMVFVARDLDFTGVEGR